MSVLSDKEAAAVLSAVGHKPLGVYTKNDLKHRFECNCGYVSTYRGTVRNAIEAGVHHMRLEAEKVLRETRREMPAVNGGTRFTGSRR